MRKKALWDNQKGSVLLITLLVLIAVTILGIAGIQTSIIELKISSNERQMREGFFLAESAAMDGVQRMASMMNKDLNDPSEFWYHSKRDSDGTDLDFRDPGKWIKDGDNDMHNCLGSAIDPSTFVAAMEWKVASASSLVMTETRLYQNRIYGLCTKYDADNLVEIGYNLRY